MKEPNVAWLGAAAQAHVRARSIIARTSAEKRRIDREGTEGTENLRKHEGAKGATFVQKQTERTKPTAGALERKCSEDETGRTDGEKTENHRGTEATEKR